MVAGLTGEATGVVCRGYLREVLWLGGAGCMAAHAQNGRVKFERLNGCRIGSVPGQRTVASFAMNAGVHSGLFLGGDVRVTGFACRLPGEVGLRGSHLRDGCPAIVPVFSEALRYNEVASDQKQDEQHRKEKGESE